MPGDQPLSCGLEEADRLVVPQIAIGVVRMSHELGIPRIKLHKATIRIPAADRTRVTAPFATIARFTWGFADDRGLSVIVHIRS
ncbi:hypothetical protein GCM10009658_43630 [Planotetraspora silvatica]